MITLEMDMIQYDCPYIDTTADHDVSFFTKQWDFDSRTRQLETRIMVSGADEEALDNGLHALGEHENMHDYELLRRKGDTAFIRSEIAETNAMRVIRDNDGYITGPFRIRDGSEIWQVGFDSREILNETLSELDRDNDFDIETERALDMEEYDDLIRNQTAAKSLIDACRSLSEVERDTLEAAVQGGYFSNPRDTTLSSLAEEFDVSKMAVSKNLRRSQRKVLGDVMGAMGQVRE